MLKKSTLVALGLLMYLVNANATETKTSIRKFAVSYKNEEVHFIVKSIKGSENQAKPLFLFIQGSLPVPLFIQDSVNTTPWLTSPPFKIPDELLENYHLVIISKPAIPLVVSANKLGRGMGFYPANNRPPHAFVKNDHLDYYVARNLYILNYLKKFEWVDTSKLVLAGHSQGSAIAVKIAEQSQDVTHVIFSGGTPLGRMMRTLNQLRKNEKDSLNRLTNGMFHYWEEIIKDTANTNPVHGGDSNKSEFSFNQNLIPIILSLQIPVLVSYGGKDSGAIFNDYLRFEAIRNQKKNISFLVLPGTEHNFFPVDENGHIDRTVFNWDKVAVYWYDWISSH